MLAAMSAKTRQTELGKQAKALLFEGDFRRAEYVLWEIARTSPRAPTSTYLLGLSILYQRRFREARRLIERAYRLRLWLDDRIGVPLTIEVLREAAEALPTWAWPHYQLLRERWRSVGMTLVAAVTHLAETRDKTPVFVQIGANDGRSDDPMNELVRKGKTVGLLVEPQEEPFTRLKENYQGVDGLKFEMAAVANEDGPLTMVTASDRSALGSVTPDRNILRLRKGDALSEITVQGLTFESLLAKHDINRFDVLQIDTEGFDYQVLRQVDLARRGVCVVNLEYYCLPVEERLAACRQLDAAGFALRFGEMDLLGVRRDEFEDVFCLTDLTAPSNDITSPTAPTPDPS